MAAREGRGTHFKVNTKRVVIIPCHYSVFNSGWTDAQCVHVQGGRNAINEFSGCSVFTVSM